MNEQAWESALQKVTGKIEKAKVRKAEGITYHLVKLMYIKRKLAHERTLGIDLKDSWMIKGRHNICTLVNLYTFKYVYIQHVI